MNGRAPIFPVSSSSIVYPPTGGAESPLKLTGANPGNLFAVFIYGVSHTFLFPFPELVQTVAFGSMVLELSSINAVRCSSATRLVAPSQRRH